MKRRKVILSPTLRRDFVNIYRWIKLKTSPSLALRYVQRIEAYCRKFDLAAERGTRRDDIRQDLRVISFEGRVTLLFLVTDEAVIFLRAFYGGQDWEEELSET
ncbi:MAG: type II toxin-antitoxin system RelE/ParE family toxin [Asticcacaulis sp.]|uniref:type II toxin-antitoxin system RelE/ParE family toxin n=1 Tax=Asticcacaulis sp. TaxID=1872648 RepID=UPI003F7BE5C9